MAGSGKSSTGNALVQREVFQVSSGPDSVTKSCEVASYSIGGDTFQVVDTCGFEDTALSPSEQEAYFKQFADLAPNGVAAFIYTVSLGQRLTRSVVESAKAFRNLCGGAVANHTILVFTHSGADIAAAEQKCMESDAVQSLVDELSPRLKVFVDNVKGTRGTCKRLRTEIAQFVRSSGQSRYQNDFLQEAQRWRSEAQQNILAIADETERKELGKLLSDLQRGRSDRATFNERLEVARTRGRQAEAAGAAEEEAEAAQRAAQQAEARAEAAQAPAEAERRAASRTGIFVKIAFSGDTWTLNVADSA